MKQAILSLIFALFMLGGCKTKERIVIQTVEVPRIEIRIDSVLVHRTDSVVRYSKGDTVFFEKYKTLYRDRIKIQKDTVSKVIEVPVEVEVEKIVTKLRTDWIWWVGMGSMGLFVILAAFKIKKLFSL